MCTEFRNSLLHTNSYYTIRFSEVPPLRKVCCLLLNNRQPYVIPFHFGQRAYELILTRKNHTHSRTYLYANIGFSSLSQFTRVFDRIRTARNTSRIENDRNRSRSLSAILFSSTFPISLYFVRYLLACFAVEQPTFHDCQNPYIIYCFRRKLPFTPPIEKRLNTI